VLIRLAGHGLIPASFFGQLDFNCGVSQRVLFERHSNGLFDGAVFVRTKNSLVIHYDMGRQYMLFTIQGPEVLVMNSADAINAN
jgi:hypothetical protein